MSSVVAILTAAGSGQRLGSALPKALVPLGGVPLIVHAARALVGGSPNGPIGDRPAPLVDLIIVTAPPGRLADVTSALYDETSGVRVLVVAGGSTRQASVAAGLAVLPEDVDVVLVHDAARALVPSELVARVIDAVRAGHAAVIPGLAVTDTIKRVGPGGVVSETLVRAELCAVQTPQGFAPDVLVRAHAHGADRRGDEASAASDDAALVEALGMPVWVVDGATDAAKITTPRDLALAELVLAARTPAQADA